jgi:hypothetical protein
MTKMDELRKTVTKKEITETKKIIADNLKKKKRKKE